MLILSPSEVVTGVTQWLKEKGQRFKHFRQNTAKKIKVEQHESPF
jgi:hypothetical protein